MVRAETLPFRSYTLATPGQHSWVYLNQLIDYEERVAKIHTHCLVKFHRDVCEVCGEPVVDTKKLPAEIQSKIYRPKDDEMKEAVDIIFDQNGREVSPDKPERLHLDLELDE